MKQFFRKFQIKSKFDGQRISHQKASVAPVIRRYKAKKKKRLLITVAVAAAAVMVPILATTAAYGNEIWKAPVQQEERQAEQEQQALLPTPTPSPVADNGALTGESTEGTQAPEEDSQAMAQGEAEVATPTEAPAADPTEAPAADPTETPAADPTEAPAADSTEAPAADPTQAPAADPTQAPVADKADPTQAPAADPAQTPAADQAQAPAADPAQAPAANPAQTPAAQAAPILNEQQQQFTEDIQPGAESPLVKTIQSRLMELHYMEKDDPTELFGPITQQSIGYFQRKHGLEVTNVATVETLHALFADDAKEYSVTIGASGTDVEEIQKRLDSLGYGVSATGYFGTDTDAAVKEFQKNNELGVDGSVGYYTKEALYSSEAITKAGDEAGTESGEGSGGGSSSMVEAFIDEAYAQLGKPYVLGAKGPNAFDCSGLIYYCLNQAGYDIGYMTSGGWRGSDFETIRSIDDLKRGDILCMDGHVAIYLGDGTVIDASSSQNAMMHRDFGSWFRNGFLCAKRVF